MATGETGIQMIVLHELTSWVVWKQLKNNTFVCDICVLAIEKLSKLWYHQTYLSRLCPFFDPTRQINPILAASEPASKNTSEYVGLIVNSGKEPKLKNDKNSFKWSRTRFPPCNVDVGHYIVSVFGQTFYWSKNQEQVYLFRTGFRRWSRCRCSWVDLSFTYANCVTFQSTPFYTVPAGLWRVFCQLSNALRYTSSKSDRIRIGRMKQQL